MRIFVIKYSEKVNFRSDKCNCIVHPTDGLDWKKDGISRTKTLKPIGMAMANYMVRYYGYREFKACSMTGAVKEYYWRNLRDSFNLQTI